MQLFVCDFECLLGFCRVFAFYAFSHGFYDIFDSSAIVAIAERARLCLSYSFFCGFMVCHKIVLLGKFKLRILQQF